MAAAAGLAAVRRGARGIPLLDLGQSSQGKRKARLPVGRQLDELVEDDDGIIELPVASVKKGQLGVRTGIAGVELEGAPEVPGRLAPRPV
jgi:hypothetical protein